MEKPLITQLEELYVELSAQDSKNNILKLKIESVLKAFYESQEQVQPAPIVELTPEFKPHPDIQSLIDGNGFNPQITSEYLKPLKTYSVIKVTHIDSEKIEYEKVASRLTLKYEIKPDRTFKELTLGRCYIVHEGYKCFDWVVELKNPVSVAKVLSKAFAMAKQSGVRY